MRATVNNRYNTKFGTIFYETHYKLNTSIIYIYMFLHLHLLFWQIVRWRAQHRQPRPRGRHEFWRTRGQAGRCHLLTEALGGAAEVRAQHHPDACLTDCQGYRGVRGAAQGAGHSDHGNGQKTEPLRGEEFLCSPLIWWPLTVSYSPANTIRSPNSMLGRRRRRRTNIELGERIYIGWMSSVGWRWTWVRPITRPDAVDLIFFHEINILACRSVLKI